MQSFRFNLLSPPIRNLALQKKLVYGICLWCLLGFGYQFLVSGTPAFPLAFRRIIAIACLLTAASNALLLLLSGKTDPVSLMRIAWIRMLTWGLLAVIGMLNLFQALFIPALLALLLLGAVIGMFQVEKRVSQPSWVLVNANGIVWHAGWFPRKFSWDSLNHIILYHDMLTLDLKNNRVIQLELSGEPASGILQDFRNFCASRLQAGQALT
jgi:hypothetical protein